MQRTGDLKLIQELNRSIILDTIRKKGPISRSQVAKEIKISPTTVTSAVNDLIRKGMVIEDGVGHSSGGRKPVLLRFNPSKHSIIAISITNSYIKMADMDLEGKILRKNVHPVNQLQGDDIILLLIDLLEQFVAGNDRLEFCEGISIITPGIVDSNNGMIGYNTKLKLYDVPLTEMIEEKFNLPTFLDNDVNAFAVGEYYFGSFNSYKDIMYLTIGDGVGSGLMINGTIYRGFKGSSGEIGHTTVVPGGSKCECGNNGCLENYVNWPAIYSSIVSSILTKGRDTLIKNLIENDVRKLTPEIFIEAIKRNDKLSIEILDEIISYLSIAISNTIHLLNPEIIIISGEVVQDNPLFIKKIREKLSEMVIPILKEDINIQSTSLGSDFDLLGAAAVILQGKFRFQL
ncbi:ROK family transcriptional regulator [Niallia circulans]|uniref:Transcriptional regulator n=1 Tax=Niallia circulans TaxID=1397 RepID=A0A0J1I810_NIACI|nr:ROK family transcriptional regulator [Niallia circulans]KLV22084.1 transcriptional regulator [Niallia circulans]MCM2983240.1 ROK family protein [Niallia circulans]MDR4316532.1 ROK family protein [Niallia circulans]MED3838294.1 ROK family protein [Niallia circulans]MED4243769.1 ROK family protein [Niallia circulans]